MCCDVMFLLVTVTFIQCNCCTPCSVIFIRQSTKFLHTPPFILLPLLLFLFFSDSFCTVVSYPYCPSLSPLLFNSSPFITLLFCLNVSFTLTTPPQFISFCYWYDLLYSFHHSHPYSVLSCHILLLGNSGGGSADYWELFYSNEHPRMQGKVNKWYDRVNGN